MNNAVHTGWELFDQARELIPFGTGTHSKAPRLRGIEPAYYVRGRGAYLWDMDGNRYIDFRNALGPVTLGYVYPLVQAAIARQLEDGIIFSAPHPLEVAVARQLVEVLPAADQVRYLKTGGEAMAAAIKLARAFTGRQHILSCGYHGWLQTVEGQQGILPAARQHCHSYRYGDIDGVAGLLNAHRGDVAAVTLAGAYADMRPDDPFPRQLRELTERHGVLLILDEIVTGFRLAVGGYHEYYGIKPDLGVVSKGVANGMPLSVFFGRRDVMQTCEHRSIVSSTFSGDALSLAAASATIAVYRSEPVIQHMWRQGSRLMEGMRRAFADHNMPMRISGLAPCPMITFRAGDDDVNSKLADQFFGRLYQHGISMYVVPYISYSLSDDDVDQALECIDEVCAELTTGARRSAGRGAAGTTARTFFVQLLAIICTGLLTLLPLPASASAEVNTIVADGRPTAVVVVAHDADARTRQAADWLIEYIAKSTGVTLPLASSHVDGNAMTIQVGLPRDGRAALLPADLPFDGFVIDSHEGGVVIAGPSSLGTLFGVCELLERYVGVRWLMPGADGEDVPRHTTLRIPRERRVERPAFFSRTASGLAGAPLYDEKWAGSEPETWGLRMRLNGALDTHHNLYKLFPPEKYVQSHPEFFPILKGRRHFPPTDPTNLLSGYLDGWQMCFTADGTVEEAVKNVKAYFKDHPDAMSCSLAINDSGGFCECDKCASAVSGKNNLFGMRDVSDLYYDWCNRVVEEVLKEYPDKYFGCLAYDNVAAPPTKIKLHPRLIPEMTWDLMQWADPQRRQRRQGFMQTWSQAAPNIGWYDYFYGSPYLLPRMYLHTWAQAVRWGHEHGVKSFYAEVYPNWGEGPKAYLAMRMLWNVNIDMDAELRDWYVRAVGPEAADDLATYYEHWEQYWTQRILRSEWFAKERQYLLFPDPSYLNEVTDQDLKLSRSLLESVLAKARTEPQRRRASRLLRSYDYYEASARAYLIEHHAQGMAPITGNDQAMAAWKLGIEAITLNDRRMKMVMNEFFSDVLLFQTITPNHFAQLTGQNWGMTPLRQALAWARRHDDPALADEIRNCARQHENPRLRQIAAEMSQLLDADR